MKRRTAIESLESRTLFTLVTFAVDPALSSLRISGNVENVFDIEAQRSGSLTAAYEGAILADVQDNVIRFPGGSNVVAQALRKYDPGSGLANYGITGKTGGFFKVEVGDAAVRDFAFDLTSPDLALGSSGGFGASGLDVETTGGRLNYDLKVGGNGEINLDDKDVDNRGAGNGTLRGEGANFTLTVPIDISFKSGSTELNLKGTLVATSGTGAPADPNAVRIGDGTLLRSVQFTDADGTASTITLTGGGSAEVRFQNATTLVAGKLGTIIVSGAGAQLTGVDATGTTTKTKLAITAKGGADAVISVPSLTTDGSAGTIGGKGTTFSGNVTVNGLVKTLTASRLSGATVTADSIGTMKVAGDVTTSTITLDAPFAPGTFAVRSFAVSGALDGSRLSAIGAIGTVKAKSMTGSEVYSGVNSGAARFPATGELAADGSIVSVAIKTFSNSVIAADTLGKLKLTSVVTANAGTAFGITADGFLSLQAANESKQKLKLIAIGDPTILANTIAAQSFNSGDFAIRLA